MKDYRIIQQDQMRRERRAFIEECSHDQFILKARRKEYPAGSTYMWCLSAVYGPKDSAVRGEAA